MIGIQASVMKISTRSDPGSHRPCLPFAHQSVAYHCSSLSAWSPPRTRSIFGGAGFRVQDKLPKDIRFSPMGVCPTINRVVLTCGEHLACLSHFQARWTRLMCDQVGRREMGPGQRENEDQASHDEDRPSGQQSTTFKDEMSRAAIKRVQCSNGASR